MLVRLLLTIAMLPMSTTAATAADTVVPYSCEDGTKLQAMFETPTSGPGSVHLVDSATGRQHDLPQVLSADGGRYADGNVEFWIKGRQATFSVDGVTTTCSAGSSP